MATYTIKVYMDDGRCYSYDVEGEDKAREHCAAIAEHGYRHNDGKVFEHYPVWRVLKVKAYGSSPISTLYPDKESGT